MNPTDECKIDYINEFDEKNWKVSIILEGKMIIDSITSPLTLSDIILLCKARWGNE